MPVHGKGRQWKCKMDDRLDLLYRIGTVTDPVTAATTKPMRKDRRKIYIAKRNMLHRTGNIGLSIDPKNQKVYVILQDGGQRWSVFREATPEDLDVLSSYSSE